MAAHGGEYADNGGGGGGGSSSVVMAAEMIPCVVCFWTLQSGTESMLGRCRLWVNRMEGAMEGPCSALNETSSATPEIDSQGI